MKCLLLATIYCFIVIVAESKYLGSKNDDGFRTPIQERLKRQISQISSSSSSSSSSTSSGNGPIQFQQTSSSLMTQGNPNLDSRFGPEENNQQVLSGHTSFLSGTFDPNTQQTYIQQHIQYPYTLQNGLPIQPIHRQ